MNPIYQPLVLLFFGFLPSLIWLRFYLHKDCHPEPTYLVSRTFLMGILLAPLAVISQWLFSRIGVQLMPGYDASQSVVFFLWAAFIEEAVKFLAVVIIVLRNPEFDEPIDAMIYMITAGLGFAAIENILVLFQAIPDGLPTTFELWILRFIGATLLHAVASGILGYFLGLSWFYQRHSKKLIAMGLVLATAVHFAFNIFLLKIDSQPGILIISTLLLIIMAFLVSILFKRLKDREQNLSTETLLA